MNEPTHYIPGMCNINPAEIRKRRLSGHIGLAAAVLIAALLVFTQSDWLYRIVVFAPVYLASIGYLQARSKFCVAYAGAGKQHADDGDALSVIDASARKADEVRARILYIQAFLIATVLTVVFCVIPLG